MKEQPMKKDFCVLFWMLNLSTATISPLFSIQFNLEYGEVLVLEFHLAVKSYDVS